MKKSISFLLAVVLCTFFVTEKIFAEGERITGEQGREKVKNGALLLDVRSPEEYSSGHVEGSLNIPHTEVESRLKEFGENKNREIVVYCRSGHRAGIAKEALEKNGFKHVFNAGGYADWPKS